MGTVVAMLVGGGELWVAGTSVTTTQQLIGNYAGTKEEQMNSSLLTSIMFL